MHFAWCHNSVVLPQLLIEVGLWCPCGCQAPIWPTGGSVSQQHTLSQLQCWAFNYCSLLRNISLDDKNSIHGQVNNRASQTPKFASAFWYFITQKLNYSPIFLLSLYLFVPYVRERSSSTHWSSLPFLVLENWARKVAIATSPVKGTLGNAVLHSSSRDHGVRT